MNNHDSLVDALTHFDSKDWSAAYTFYLEALVACGFSLDSISPERMFENSAAITMFVEAIQSASTESMMREAATNALRAYPYNIRSLLGLALSTKDAPLSLACALAIRQIIEHPSRTGQSFRTNDDSYNDVLAESCHVH